MQLDLIQHNSFHIVEVISEGVVINSVDDALQIMMDCRYVHQVDKAIFYQKNITADFFELKTKLAGEILQKFTQYHFDVAIVGDFSIYNSKSLADFIFESNKSNKVNFVANREQALISLSKGNLLCS